MKKRISKELKIGVAFVISILILYFGISFLKGINIFRPANSYTVVFEDVTDLVLSSPVVMNGLQVGLVHSIKMDSDNPRNILVGINLNKGIDIPKGSVFELDNSFIGGAKVLFKPDYESKTYHSSDDLIKGIRNTGMMESLSSNLLPQFSGLLPKIDSILVGLQVIVNNPALNQSVDNVEQITNQLNVSTKQLSLLLANLNKDIPTITSNVASASEDIKKLTGKANNMDIEATYQSINQTMKNLETLTSKINSKDNSLGLLLNDKQLYDSINITLNNASLLLKDVKENPGRYINVKVF
ncbi:MCE family protein [Dysgonomonas sp. 216]|uniref:MlaD family protein n=1 Tax=Dysgonomonas sp. 216 TaxID=2302934 RepID=UPI0013D58B23|nr:MlaD family protein [Dysgonomonas sp. 216]NDW18031.1 MCE family protein [Dysgonomonas sp. 216]